MAEYAGADRHGWQGRATGPPPSHQDSPLSTRPYAVAADQPPLVQDDKFIYVSLNPEPAGDDDEDDDAQEVDDRVVRVVRVSPVTVRPAPGRVSALSVLIVNRFYMAIFYGRANA